MFQAARTFMVLLVVCTMLSQGTGYPTTTKDDSKSAGDSYRPTGEVGKSDSEWYRLMSSTPPKRRVIRASVPDIKTWIICGEGQRKVMGVCMNYYVNPKDSRRSENSILKYVVNLWNSNNNK